MKQEAAVSRTLRSLEQVRPQAAAHRSRLVGPGPPHLGVPAPPGHPYPDIELRLIRTNSPTGGLAGGLCDLAVVRTPAHERRFAATSR